MKCCTHKNTYHLSRTQLPFFISGFFPSAKAGPERGILKSAKLLDRSIFDLKTAVDKSIYTELTQRLAHIDIDQLSSMTQSYQKFPSQNKFWKGNDYFSFFTIRKISKTTGFRFATSLPVVLQCPWKFISSDKILRGIDAGMVTQRFVSILGIIRSERSAELSRGGGDLQQGVG